MKSPAGSVTQELCLALLPFFSSDMEALYRLHTGDTHRQSRGLKESSWDGICPPHWALMVVHFLTLVGEFSHSRHVNVTVTDTSSSALTFTFFPQGHGNLLLCHKCRINARGVRLNDGISWVHLNSTETTVNTLSPF